MAGNIKGITVELNGNTTNLTKSINDANKACNSIAKELKTVDNLLKLDPGNVTLVKQKADLLNDSIAKTRTKLEELEASQAQVTAQFKAGDIDAGQYRKFQQDIVKARTDIAALEEQQKSVTGIGGAFTVLKGKVGEVTEKLEPLTNGIKKAGQISGEVFKIGATALAAYSGAIIAAGVATTGYASNLNEVQNVVDTAFGDRGAGKINEFAADAAASFGLSELQAKQFSGTMGAILKSTGFTGSALEDMSTSVTGLAGDFASFYNMDSEAAFEKIRSGLSGETEPLKALGINMSETNLSAYALSQGITKSYSAMTEAEKVQLRYNYLMSATTDAQGDFAKTSDGFANQQRIASLQLQTLSGAIGNVFLPIFTNAMQQVTSTLPQVTEAFDDALGGDGAAAQALTSGIAEMLNNLVSSISAFLPQLLAGFNGVLLSLVGGLAQSLPTVIATILPALMQGLTGLISGLVSLVPTVLPALIEGAAVLFTGIITGLTQIIPQIIEILPALVTQICGVLVENLPLLLDAAVQIIVAVTAAVIANFPQILTAVTSGLGNVLNSVITWFGGLMSQLGTWLAGIGEIVVAFFSTAFSTMVENLSTIWTNVTTWFNNLIAGVGSWLASVISTIITFAANMVSNAVQAASGFVGSIIKGISNLPANVGNTLINVISRAADFVSDMASKAADAAKGFIKNIVNGLADLPQKMTDIGGNIVKGMWKGIQDGWQWLTDSVANLADGLLNAAKKALGIHSPSTKFRDAVGKNMALGIGVGFAETMSKVRNDMAKAIPTNFTSGITLNAQTTAKRAADTLAAAGISLTVINNSPKAISAAESARLTRNALRTFVLQTGGAV